MYGIPDFEAKINQVSDEDLRDHVTMELARIPWSREKRELLPKPSSQDKYIYEADFLSEILVERQEKAQAFQQRLIVF